MNVSGRADLCVGIAEALRNWVELSRLAGKIRSTGKFRGRVLSVTCRREADRWFCSLTVQVDRPDPIPVVGPVVGVDRGITRFAVCCDGTTILSPRASEQPSRAATPLQGGQPQAARLGQSSQGSGGAGPLPSARPQPPHRRTA